MKLEEEDCDYGIQIENDFSLGPKAGEESEADMVNHSCEPNLGFMGQVFLVTLRDVAQGEELCFDCAMCLGGKAVPVFLHMWNNELPEDDHPPRLDHP